MQILIITNQWPSAKQPASVPFLVEQVESLRQAGIKVTVFDFNGKMNPVNYLKAWQRLRGQLNFSDFNLVHAHFGQSGLLVLPPPLPFVVTFHGSDLLGVVGENGRYTPAGVINRQVSRLVARFADDRIVVAEHLIQFLPNHLSAVVIPCGIDMTRFKPISQLACRRELGLSENKRYALFAANPGRAVKRFDLAQQAVSLVPSYLNLELLALKNVPYDRIPLYMNASDVLILTSHHEGSPTVIKEALACNLPVVSVDVGDVSRFLDGLPGSILCQDDSISTIAQAIVKVVGADCPGRERIRELDHSNITPQIISVYEQLLSAGIF